MQLNSKLINETIKLRNNMNDPPRKISVRNKASPNDTWQRPVPYSKAELIITLYFLPIDGIRLDFQYSQVEFDGRHNKKKNAKH